MANTGDKPKGWIGKVKGWLGAGEEEKNVLPQTADNLAVAIRAKIAVAAAQLDNLVPPHEAVPVRLHSCVKTMLCQQDIIHRAPCMKPCQ